MLGSATSLQLAFSKERNPKVLIKISNSGSILFIKCTVAVTFRREGGISKHWRRDHVQYPQSKLFLLLFRFSVVTHGLPRMSAMKC